MHFTEVTSKKERSAFWKETTAAGRQEIKSILDEVTFKFISLGEVPPDSDVLLARFLLTLKSTKDGEVK